MLPSLLPGLSLPLPQLYRSRCAACVSPGSPLRTPQPGSCVSRASSPPPHPPPPSPGLAPCHWGWRWNHPPTRPASPVTLPPSSLPQVSLLENSRQMSAGERWACGPGAELQLGLDMSAGPRMGRGPVSARLQGDSLGRAAAPRVLDLHSPGQGSGCLHVKGFFPGHHS